MPRPPTITAATARGEHAGSIRIEAGALEIKEVLPAWMRRVRAQLSQLEIVLRETQSADYARLRRDEVDVIVDYQPKVPEGIATRRVAVHRAFLVYGKQHPRGQSARPPRMQDFRAEPWAATRDSSLRA